MAAKADIHNHGREQNFARNSTYKKRHWIRQCSITSLMMLDQIFSYDSSEMLMHMSFHIWTNLSSLPRWFSNTLAPVKIARSCSVSMSESMIMAYIVKSTSSLEICSCAMRFLNTSSMPSYTTRHGSLSQQFVLSQFITNVLPSQALNWIPALESSDAGGRRSW